MHSLNLKKLSNSEFEKLARSVRNEEVRRIRVRFNNLKNVMIDNFKTANTLELMNRKDKLEYQMKTHAKGKNSLHKKLISDINRELNIRSGKVRERKRTKKV